MSDRKERDLRQDAEFSCDVAGLPAFTNGATWPLVIADPPYSPDDSVKYGTPPIDRGAVMRALAAVTAPGGFVCWLDVCWPMFRKDQWRTVARIALTRSTNHRLRDVSIFERRRA